MKNLLLTIALSMITLSATAEVKLIEKIPSADGVHHYQVAILDESESKTLYQALNVIPTRPEGANVSRKLLTLNWQKTYIDCLKYDSGVYACATTYQVP